MTEEDFTPRHPADPRARATARCCIRTEWVGIDATVRTWLSKAEGYIEPVEIGDVVRGSGIGRVLQSKSDKVPGGRARRHAHRLAGVRGRRRRPDAHHAAGRGHRPARRARRVRLQRHDRLRRHARGRQDQGGRDGRRVRRRRRHRLDRRADRQAPRLPRHRHRRHRREVRAGWSTSSGSTAPSTTAPTTSRTKLRELCPKRVDVFFDNTGGPILDAVLGRIADRARVVLCGAISSYNDHHKPPGPPNYLNLISRRARMEGFISWDSWGRWAEITGMLAEWIADGQAQSPLPRLRGPRRRPPGPQRHVHRREHRQDRHPSRRRELARLTSRRRPRRCRRPSSRPGDRADWSPSRGAWSRRGSATCLKNSAPPSSTVELPLS